MLNDLVPSGVIPIANSLFSLKNLDILDTFPPFSLFLVSIGIPPRGLIIKLKGNLIHSDFIVNL